GRTGAVRRRRPRARGDHRRAPRAVRPRGRRGRARPGPRGRGGGGAGRRGGRRGGGRAAAAYLGVPGTARPYREYGGTGADSGPGAMMTREEVDRALAGLAGLPGLADTLLSVENHPGYRHLREHTPAGRTREVWQQLEPGIRVMWAQYSVLN